VPAACRLHCADSQPLWWPPDIPAAAAPRRVCVKPGWPDQSVPAPQAGPRPSTQTELQTGSPAPALAAVLVWNRFSKNEINKL